MKTRFRRAARFVAVGFAAAFLLGTGLEFARGVSEGRGETRTEATPACEAAAMAVVDFGAARKAAEEAEQANSTAYGSHDFYKARAETAANEAAIGFNYEAALRTIVNSPECFSPADVATAETRLGRLTH